MNADDELEGLKRIRQVDAPPFLYTRIRARIDALASVPAPVQWVRAFAVCAGLVLILNVGAFLSVIDQTSSQTGSDVANVVNALQLASTNTFYHE